MGVWYSLVLDADYFRHSACCIDPAWGAHLLVISHEKARSPIDGENTGYAEG